jgi:hypothetical protein
MLQVKLRTETFKWMPLTIQSKGKGAIDCRRGNDLRVGDGCQLLDGNA